MGNISPSEIGGITAQDFLWFYSDLTAIKYYKNSKSGLVNALSVDWTYELVTAQDQVLQKKSLLKLQVLNTL